MTMDPTVANAFLKRRIQELAETLDDLVEAAIAEVEGRTEEARTAANLIAIYEARVQKLRGQQRKLEAIATWDVDELR